MWTGRRKHEWIGEDGSIESMQSEQRENKMKKSTQSLREMWASVMWANRHTMGVSEEEDGKKWSQKDIKI